MRPRAALTDLRTLATPHITRRGALVAAIALLERILTPALAWTLVQRTLRDKVAVTLLFGLVFTVRTLIQRVFLARTEGELLERTAASVLTGDILRADILADQDLRLEATQAVYLTSQHFSQTLPNAIGDAFACVLLAVVVASLEPARLVAFAAAVTLVAAAALLVSRRTVGRAVERAWKVQGRVYEAFGDVLEGRLEIVASGRRGAFMADLRDRTLAWSSAGVRVAGATVLSGRLALAAVAGLVSAALFADGQLRGSLTISLTDVALFASVTPAFAGVAQGVHGLVRDERWVRLLARVMRGGARVGSPGARPPPPLPAPIAFERVSFRYEGAESPRPALTELDLAWNGRDVLALSGANGSGKSTCLRLLLALAPPIAGTVLVGGVALEELDPDAWRARVAFLPQRPYLPPRADVRRALRWPLSVVSDERMVQALDRVGLLPVLRRGGGDPLEVRVDSLSVGERQRVALARLLCRDAALFLLDEPDANLDRAGIALVAELLRELAGRAMVAFAAHTPELLAVADRVVELEGGRVVR
jgi:ABC-type multidrug transport system fused ATPase/permease subunit